jgi:hypothetical protein
VVVLVVLLAVTNAATLGALGYLLLRRTDQPAPDPALARALTSAVHGPSSSATRRIITVEILNARELAATRGRLAGVAHTLAPGLVRRVVYDQTVRQLRTQLAAEQVAADVRLLAVGPAGADRHS